MIVDLLIGLPNDRPGGLLLSVLSFLAAAAGGFGTGLVYAGLCSAFPAGTISLQGAAALLRGVPVILLVFLMAHVLPLGLWPAAVLALALYSFSHVGEILRSYLSAYPQAQRDQAAVTGLRSVHEFLRLRVPRTLAYSADAVTTHWVSLLKDTGALVVLSVGELTTVAKAMSESTASSQRWFEILLLAALLYLTTTLTLLKVLHVVRARTLLSAILPQ